MEPSTLVALFGVTAISAVIALVLVLSRKTRTEDQARAYLAGFTYVLSNDADAAIAELSRAAQLSNQDLETWLALGALFRRKGELERALRLHQNILLRPGLPPEIRRRAKLALAEDYRRSALKDKAREVFDRILAEDPAYTPALVRYRQLLEESGEWARAAELQARWVRLEGPDGGILAHLLAAHARTLLPGEPEEALQVATRAVELGPTSADAQWALAEALAARGRREEALGPLETALTLEPELAPRAVTLLGQVAPPAAAERLLRRLAAEQGPGGAPCALALALWMRDGGRIEDATALLRRVVAHRPWFWEARKELGALLLAQDRSEEMRADYRQILGTLGHPLMGFACTHCQQKLPEHAFRCPSCESWDTVRREEGPGLAAREAGGS